MTDIVRSAPVQSLLDRASGLGESGGNPRLKAITRDLLQAIMTIIDEHDISESEFWQAVKFLQDGAGEFGLIAPGAGLEHFLDLHMDAKDAAAGRIGGTPRTIEGPLYVEGAPLVEGDVNLSSDPDDTILSAELIAAERLIELLDRGRTRVGVISFSGNAELQADLEAPPEELAAANCFLLSEESAFITGQTLYVDGGSSIGHAPV